MNGLAIRVRSMDGLGDRPLRAKLSSGARSRGFGTQPSPPSLGAERILHFDFGHDVPSESDLQFLHGEELPAALSAREAQR